MTFEIVFVLVALTAMVTALAYDIMRPGLVLFCIVVSFLCVGILTPKQVLEGFSNKGMITVGLLFLVSEGVRQSGALSSLMKNLLPERKATVRGALVRMLPSVAAISAFLNNTPVVVIFAPIIKKWAEKMHLPATKFLIPLSYATILGGVCTLIGTSTNLVVHGMVLDAGYEGFTMFELGKVGVFIALAGILYLVFFANRLLPDNRTSHDKADDDDPMGKIHRVEAVLGPRFPGIRKSLDEFDFYRHYGAIVREIRRNGRSLDDIGHVPFKEGDTLILYADDTFIPTWGESSVFLMVSNGTDYEDKVKHKKARKWFAMLLLLFMIAGATVGELPVMREKFPDIKLDMFFFVCVTTVVMACTKLFPPKKYTKYISWDILITIACAFAISRAMESSGFADAIASRIIGASHHLGPHVLLAVLFLITNLFTELITNNAAAALSFPIALSVATQLGVDPEPFFVVICMAASASFSTPIGYQTNLIVQGVGNYRFQDFVKVGLPLNIIAFVLSVTLIPLFWKF